MISIITGLLVEKYAPHLVINVNGVGYEIAAPMSVFYTLPSIGEELTLHTHFIVREDAQLLYGFNNRNERELFRTLIKVNGVGPKLGLTILSGIEGEALVRCMHDRDSDRLVKLPGVGKKTAERLIVEMRDKLDNWQPSPTSNSNSSEQGSLVIPLAADIEEEATSALVALGYKQLQASRVVKTIYYDGIASEELIRQALKSMV